MPLAEWSLHADRPILEIVLALAAGGSAVPRRLVADTGAGSRRDVFEADRRREFACYVSQVVIDEASQGDPAEIAKRMAVINDLTVLEVTEAVESLTRAILSSGVIPERALRDAAHVAVAAIHGIDYLLTWNCKHLANAQIMRRISLVCERLGQRMPIICTPDELMGV